MATDKIAGMSVTDGQIVSQAVGGKATAADLVDGSTLNRSATTGSLSVGAKGAAATGGVPRDGMSKFAGFWIHGNLVASDAVAGIFQEQNTYSTDLGIIRCVIDVTTVATAACTADIGVGSSASTSYDNLLDGADLNVGVKMQDNLGDPGTNGKSIKKWPAGEYANASMASGATSGLVGTYAIHVVDIN
jgi:hypothetical protein